MFKGLLKKLKKRDQDAERIIFETFYQRVYHAAYFIVQNREVAEDVAQDTFIKAFNSMETVQDGEKMGAWLAAIATRTAIDYTRKENRWNKFTTEDVLIDESLHSDHDTGSAVESIVEKRFLKKVLMQQLDELKPEYKQALLLKYIHGMSYDEMAAVLNVHPSTIKTRTYRAKLKLRESIERQPDLKEMMLDAET